eukprot:scaffold5862_cov91-Skeletonema_marinoi.AAC.7
MAMTSESLAMRTVPVPMTNTEWFTDRPFQLEATQPTSEWFKNFTELFDDEKGMPNAALTIVHDDISRDVVVTVFAEGYIKDTEAEGEGGGEGQTYGYKLEQSTSQESVMSLEALMGGEDSREPCQGQGVAHLGYLKLLAKCYFTSPADIPFAPCLM